MRITVKILGVLSALFGAFLLSIFPFTLGYAIRTSDNGAVFASCIQAVLGLGFILAGRHFFRVNLDSADPAPLSSNLTLFVLNHRRECKVLAQAGLTLSLIRLGIAAFGSDWPARQTTWFLLIGGGALDYCARKAADPAVTNDRDWMHVPSWIRWVVKSAHTAVNALIVAAALLDIYDRQHHLNGDVSHYATRLALAGMVTFMYALTALFFVHGELRESSAETAASTTGILP